MNYEISVIIPVFNGEKYLRQCLDCILNQTFRDFEVIIVDDGSTDLSVQILEEYASRDDRIKIIKKSHEDAGAARNLGLCQSSGRYLAFLDADDIFEPTLLEKEYDACIHHDAEISICRCDLFDDETGTLYSKEESVNRSQLPENDPFSPNEIRGSIFNAFTWWAWDKLFLRKLIIDNNICFQPIRTTNDLCFTALATLSSKSITVVDEVLVHHRINNPKSLENTRNKSLYCYLDALSMLRNELRMRGLFSKYQQDFINYFVTFSTWQLSSINEESRRKLALSVWFTWNEFFDVGKYDADLHQQSESYREFLNLVSSYGMNLEKAFVFKKKYENEQIKVSELERKLDARNVTIDSLEAKEKDLQQLLHNQIEISFHLKNSISYRVGQCLTYVPRKLYNLLTISKNQKE